jgi:hypothetical protein
MPIIAGAIVAPEMQDDRRRRHGTKTDDDDAGPLVAGGVNQRTRGSDCEHAGDSPHSDDRADGAGAPAAALQ